MFRSITLFTATLLTVGLFAATDVEAKSRHLGSTKLAHHENDVDIIHTTCKPRINAIKLKAKNGRVEIEKLWVRYGNGGTDTVHIRERIAQGGETRWIDLRLGKRCVTEIGVIGDTELSLDRARVEVYGRY